MNEIIKELRELKTEMTKMLKGIERASNDLNKGIKIKWKKQQKHKR